MRGVWRLLQTKSNRAVLSWLGGGLVVVVAGLWAVMTYVWPPNSKPPSAPNVSASGNSVAAGGGISGSTITQHTTGGPPASHPPPAPAPPPASGR